MSTSSVGRRRPLATSPFQTPPEAVIPTFEVGARVCHDSHGIGRVTNVEAQAVTVDFSHKTVRVVSPYTKMEHL